MKCETCRYWLAVLSEAGRQQALKDDNQDQDVGWCRRYPPAYTGGEEGVSITIQCVMATDGGVFDSTPVILPRDGNGDDPLFDVACWDFPVTEFDSWCGEYSALTAGDPVKRLDRE